MTENAIIPQLVQSLAADDGHVTHTILAELDKDPAFHNVESILSDLAGVENSTRWLVGDILVFVRVRANYQTVQTFVWDGAGPFPPEVQRYVRERYRVRVDQCPEPAVEFVCWQTLRWPKFWILYRPGEVRIWERQDRIEWTDERFDQQMYVLAGRVHAQLNEKTLRSYYRTSFMFPPSTRGLLSWTWYFEQANKAGQDPRLQSVVGEERLLLQAAIAQDNAQKDEENGRTRVNDVRADIRENKVNGRGWDWYVPPLAVVEVKDTQTGEVLVGLELTDHPAAEAILGATGLMRFNGRYPDLWLAGDRVEDDDGNLVASIPHLDDPVVGKAIIDIAGVMKWRVKRG